MGNAELPSNIVLNNRSWLGRRNLWQMSAFYLLLPVIIFAASWLRWWVALPMIGAAMLAFITLATDGAGLDNGRGMSGRAGLAMLAILTLFLALTGIGGWGFQDRDWEKHNAMLKLLITSDWPAHYAFGTESLPITYYVAYYLPAAVVGKLIGWQGANHLLFLWSLLGLFLALLWFAHLVGDRHPFVVLPFLLFSGLDVVGKLLVTPLLQQYSTHLSLLPVDYSHIEWWAGRFQYSSNVTQLFWVPHQALAGWILTGMILTQLELPRPHYAGLAWLWSLSLLWSPFVALGLLPFLVVDVINRRLLATPQPSPMLGQEWRVWRSQIFSPLIWSTLITIGVMAVYYASKLVPPAAGLAQTAPFGLTLGSQLSLQEWAISFADYLIFCLLEFGLFAALIVWARRNQKAEASQPSPAYLLPTTIFVLLLLPLVRYGWYNDLTMRASIPALFVLNVYFVRVLYQQSPNATVRWAIAALLWVGSATPFFEMYRHVGRMIERNAIIAITPAEQVSLANLQDYEQALYLSSPKTWFFEYLARRN